MGFEAPTFPRSQAPILLPTRTKRGDVSELDPTNGICSRPLEPEVFEFLKLPV